MLRLHSYGTLLSRHGVKPWAAPDKSPDYEGPNCTVQRIELLLPVAPMRKRRAANLPALRYCSA